MFKSFAAFFSLRQPRRSYAKRGLGCLPRLLLSLEPAFYGSRFPYSLSVPVNFSITVPNVKIHDFPYDISFPYKRFHPLVVLKTRIPIHADVALRSLSRANIY